MILGAFLCIINFVQSFKMQQIFCSFYVGSKYLLHFILGNFEITYSVLKDINDIIYKL